MLVTIFTPTYNRSNLLIRLYQSLKTQLFMDFEWVIVDDGSTDNTGSVVAEFQKDSIFPIRYVSKDNGGKHTAYNLALELAEGKYFINVDSDDWLPTDSILEISNLVSLIESHDNVAGLIALKKTADNRIINKPFRKENILSRFRDLELSGDDGERTIIFKTNIARSIKFPVIKGENFCTEAVVYDQFNANYKFLVTNKALTICEYQEDGLSSNPQKIMLKNPGGYSIYYKNRIDMAVGFKERSGYIIRYNFFKYLSKSKGIEKYRGKYRLSCNLLFFLTPGVYLYYFFKTK